MISDIAEIFVRVGVIVLAVVVLTRINGLRSFAKMSSFDFAITVATGSVIASAAISPKEPIWYGLAALAALFVVQWALALARSRWKFAESSIDNSPVLIMKDGVILEENLRFVRMTKADVYGKLREANAYDLSTVHAVIFEATGDVSVLHGTKDDGKKISDAVIQDVLEYGAPASKAE